MPVTARGTSGQLPHGDKALFSERSCNAFKSNCIPDASVGVVPSAGFQIEPWQLPGLHGRVPDSAKQLPGLVLLHHGGRYKGSHSEFGHGGDLLHFIQPDDNSSTLTFIFDLTHRGHREGMCLILCRAIVAGYLFLFSECSPV